MESITYTIELVYQIKDAPGYSFGKDKHLYNTKTGRKLNQCLNGGSIGYWLNGKFYTLKKLRSLLYKQPKKYSPF